MISCPQSNKVVGSAHITYLKGYKAAKDFYDGGGLFTSTNAKQGGLPGTSFHTSDAKQQTDFPADYRVFVFAAQTRGGWNHGESYGIVVSQQRNEVIYYAEDW